MVSRAVQALARVAREQRLDVPPGAAAEAALASAVRKGSDCQDLASSLAREISSPDLHTEEGWGGYAGTLGAWRFAHSESHRFEVSGPGRVFTLVERFSTPLTATLALASIEQLLLPGKLHVVYALKAAECQQAIFMGSTLGKFFGNGNLGAFVQLSTGKGVGRTRYDAKRVNRARITPLGRIGGQPCT